jgi:hypothetical protein
MNPENLPTKYPWRGEGVGTTKNRRSHLIGRSIQYSTLRGTISTKSKELKTEE